MRIMYMGDTIRKLKNYDIIDTENEVMFGVLSGARTVHLKGLKVSVRHLMQWYLISLFRV